MADEYIRKQDAVGAVEFGITLASAINIETGEWTELFQRENDELREAVKRIKDIEPADVVQVVHAHWYILEYESLTCSRCEGFYYTGCDSTAEAKERLKEGIYPNYCPHCGAKMDEGKNA